MIEDTINTESRNEHRYKTKQNITTLYHAQDLNFNMKFIFRNKQGSMSEYVTSTTFFSTSRLLLFRRE